MNIYQPVLDFEKALAEYCGSKYAVVVDSCTNALLLCCSYHEVKEVTIPKHTYNGVPMAIIHAGGKVKFCDEEWQEKGWYPLAPYPIYDSARLLTSNMYEGGFVCVSFHWGKTLNLGQGGAILHDSKEAKEWFERARFDGRRPGVPPKDDDFILGWHCNMSPANAAEGLTRLHFLPKHNDPLPEEKGYADLSKFKVFK